MHEPTQSKMASTQHALGATQTPLLLQTYSACYGSRGGSPNHSRVKIFLLRNQGLGLFQKHEAGMALEAYQAP